MPTKATQHQETDESYGTSWYSLNPNRLLATLGPLKGEINCDVCVIGGGLTGISSALELAQRNYSVTLLEASGIADSTSGKNGGHLVRGYNLSPAALSGKFGSSTAKTLCNLTLEGLALIIARMAKHDIKCDMKFGHVTVAGTGGHAASLQRQIDEWADIGHTDLKYLDASEISGFVKSEKYVGGLLDPKGAHFHPLNYALGIAQAAKSAGCVIHDETPALSLERGSSVRIATPLGVVRAKFVILAGHIHLPEKMPQDNKTAAMTSYMIATEPLGRDLASKILPKNPAVLDGSHAGDYFHLSYDNRLLFGGERSFGKFVQPGHDASLRKKMVKIFPELSDAKIAHHWDSPMDITLNRLPAFGRAGPNIFYARGHEANGAVLSNLAGKLIAEAVSNTAERFDVFAKMGHMPFVGGRAVWRPVFSLGEAWNRLRELLSS